MTQMPSFALRSAPPGRPERVGCAAVGKVRMSRSELGALVHRAIAVLGQNEFITDFGGGGEVVPGLVTDFGSGGEAVPGLITTTTGAGEAVPGLVTTLPSSGPAGSSWGLPDLAKLLPGVATAFLPLLQKPKPGNLTLNPTPLKPATTPGLPWWGWGLIGLGGAGILGLVIRAVVAR